MNELMLLENPGRAGNPDAAEAMSLAADYRAEGMSPSQALKAAWAEVRGEGNPGEGMTSASPAMLLLLALAAFTAIWKVVKKQWPWESFQLAQRKQLARPAPSRPNPASMSVVLNPDMGGSRTISPRRNGSEEQTGAIIP